MNTTALEVVNDIVLAGFSAYLVGGYPRDYYMGINSADYDICTSANPQQLKQIFGLSMLPQESYGSVTVMKNGNRFEITTFRKDISYINNRRPLKIEYVNDLLEDLKRRDFTINTMCIDNHGQLIDLLDGQKDIEKRIIRTVGDAETKLSEDSLRILRAVRFATTLNFTLDESVSNAILKYGYLVENLSFYRKKTELDKIFSSPNVMYGIELLKRLNLDKYLAINLENVVPTTYMLGIWSQVIINNKYSFNSTEKDTIIKVKELLDKNVLDDVNLYKYGLYISTIAGEIKGIDKVEILKHYNELYIHNKDEIAIAGLQICNLLDKKPGSFLKNIIKDIEEKLVLKQLKNDKESLEQYIIEKYK